MDEVVKRKPGRPRKGEEGPRTLHRQLLDDVRKANKTTALHKQKKYSIRTVDINDDGWFNWEGNPEPGLYWVRGNKEMCPKLEKWGVPAWHNPAIKHHFQDLYLIGVIRLGSNDNQYAKEGPRWFGYPWTKVEDKFFEFCQFKRVENELNGNIPLAFKDEKEVKVEDPTSESEEVVENDRQEP